MKKINIKNRFFLVTLTLGMTIFISSCEEFLDEVNPNEIRTEIFWTTVNEMELGLNAVYNAFKDVNLLQLANECHRGDMTYPGLGRPNPNPNNIRYWAHLYTSADQDVERKWNALYDGILRANQVIEAYGRIAPNLTDEIFQERATVILAQARFFRGLFHFYLHTSFNNGEVIIRDKVPQTLDEINNKSLSPSSDVKAFFRDDLNFAANNLPASWASGDFGRVTTGAAIAVLGKSFLYENDYATAAQLFRVIVDELDYSLVEDPGDNFSTATEFNSESILEINYSISFKVGEGVNSDQGLSNNINRRFANQNVGGFRNIYPACWLIMEYKRDTPDPLDTLGDLSNKVLVRDNAANAIPKADGSDSTKIRQYSIRTSSSIALVDDLQGVYYQRPAAAVTIFNNRETAYWKKNTNSATLSDERDLPNADKSGVNVNVIRLADIYLMLAECLIEGGTNEAGVDEALIYINRVRRRAKVVLLGPDGEGEFPNFTQDGNTYTAQQLMQHLMFVERPLELSAEGHAIRFFDLRRWGITEQRFQDLTPSLYASGTAAGHFRFVNENGQTVTRFSSILREVTTEADADNQFLNARSLPAQNYSDALHAYLPIPQSEIANNQTLDEEQ